jgi:PAS domain S-box-containing protein
MPGRGTYKILIIEDNPGDFALVEDFLFEKITAPVITNVTTYKAADDILSHTDNQFDIILLDLSLPDKTGESLILEILAKSNSVPVIVLTGYTNFDFGVKSLSLGIADYLLKDELTALSLHKSIIYSFERKKYIADLKESEKRYSEVFHFSPLPIWIVNVDTMRFLDVNKAAIDHYGYTREELLTMTLKDIRPVEELPDLDRGLAEDKRNPGAVSHRTMIHKKKNGGLINVDIQIAPFQYKGVKATIAITTDITERLNYIKAIEDQNEKLKEISWMQSHIIRAPLSRIMGLIPLIENAEEDKDEIGKMLRYLVLSANELDEVIKNITDKTKVVDYQSDRLKA